MEVPESFSGQNNENIAKHKLQNKISTYLGDHYTSENIRLQINEVVNKKTISEILDNLFDYKLANIILKKSKITQKELYQDLTNNQKHLKKLKIVI